MSSIVPVPAHAPLRPAKARCSRLAVRALFLLLCCAVATAGCGGGSARKSGETTSLSRADPGYLQWLEKQSLLGQANEYSRIVTGSELGWQTPPLQMNPMGLLRDADMWLRVHPHTLITTGKRNVLQELTEPMAQAVLKRGGFKGLYIGPTGEAGAIWAYARHASYTGEDVTSHAFAEAVGDAKSFARLAQQLEASRMSLGADVVPAATGMGPDFFLAARAVRDQAGVYCMVEMPQEVWPLLPEAPSEWRAAPLGAEVMEALAARRLLPLFLPRDENPLLSRGGWAVTGQVRGADGTLRRWAYRYHLRPERPVLNWDDPSGAARRVVSASIIRQVGTLRQALVGFHAEPLIGLAPAALPVPAGEPGPSAMLAVSREVQRYGAWSWMRDPLPLNLLASLPGGDFAADSVTTPNAEYALLTGDASPLRSAMDEAISRNIEQHRLVRSLPAQDGVDFTLLARPGDASFIRPMLARWGTRAPMDDNTLYATAATLAAIGAGYAPEQVSHPDVVAAILRGHLLLTTFRAALPGLLMLSGQDIAGTLAASPELLPTTHETQPTLVSRGAWGFDLSARGAHVTTQGMPAAPAAYPSPAVQTRLADSYLDHVAHLARLRQHTGVARGAIKSRPQTVNPGSISIVTELPDGSGRLVTMANFSRDPVTERVGLKALGGVAGALGVDAHTGQQLVVGLDGLHVPLEGWQCRVILLGPGARSWNPK